MNAHDPDRPRHCPRDHTCPSRYNTHDTAAAYRHGCTSAAAADAARRYRKRHAAGLLEPRWVPALATGRLIQAMVVMGWTQRHIADRARLHPKAIPRLLTAKRVHVDSANAIRGAATQLAHTVGPSTSARSRALAKGWAPIVAWDDLDDPRERPKFGERARGATQRVDHDPEIARLTAAGLSADQIAERLGINRRTVHRARGRNQRRQGGAAA